MPTKDPRVDAYIEKAQPFARPILRYLRKVVHAGCPDCVEGMKWSFPHFDYKGIFCSMAAFKEHCTFGFWKGALVKGIGVPPGGTDAMGQFGRITSVDQLPGEKQMIAIVKAAAKLNDDGVKLVRKKMPPKPTLKTPAYLTAAFKTNKKARSTFEAFSPSNKRDYVEWLIDAKSDETRQRRLDTAIGWMAEGKIRNWKYVPK